MILQERESYSTQIWIGVGLVGGIMIVMGLLSPRGHQGRDPMGDQALSYNYEMPRVETEDMPFDLSDREVSRRTRELEALAKKKKDAVKMADLKKAKTAAEIAKKVAEAKAKAQAKAAQEARRRAQMKIATVEASERYRMQSGLSNSGTGSNSYDQERYIGAISQTGSGKSSSGTTKTEDDVEELTLSQWRALLTADPSTANVAKLLKSRAAGKIDDASMVVIVEDLLKDSGEDRQTAGLLIMTSAPSATMFSFIVKERSEFSAEIQTKMAAETSTYSQANKLTYLTPVVSSSTDSTLLTAAFEQISIAIELYKKNQNSTVGTSGGSVASLGQLQSFLNSLKMVGSGDNSSVAQAAQNLAANITSLSSTSNVASTNKLQRGLNRVASSNE